VYGLYSRHDLMFSQPQISNTVEYHFGVGLRLWNRFQKTSSNSCYSSNAKYASEKYP